MTEGIDEQRQRFRAVQTGANSTASEQPTGHHATYYPGVQVSTPKNIVGDIDTAKMGMLFSIIGGVIALAIAIGRFMTSELDSDVEFLYMALGAALLVLFSYGFVEVQQRRHGSISIVHDYVLSFGHLFAILGGFWFSRWALFYFCGYYPSLGEVCGAGYGSAEWMPAGWGALVQAVLFALIGLYQWQQNERVGATMLPRLVTVLAPLVILLIGAEIWVSWAGDAISLPVILSALLLTGMGMWLASASNRAPLFLAAAILSLVIPFAYEMKVGGGAGLTLLAMVVLMQGVFASAPGLSRQMIQHGSILLVLIILFAEFVAVVGELDLVLVKAIDNPLASLPLFIWLSLLIGYFIPVHMRRVPWMPIGLGIGLAFLPSPGSGIAWALAIIAFVYMLNQQQTRRWVADWTYAMMATSWFLVDWLSSLPGGDNPFSILALDSTFLVVPPAALLFLGGIASNHGRLSKAPYHLMVTLTLLSHEMLFGTDAYLPLVFVGYLLLLVAVETRKSSDIEMSDMESRLSTSVLVLVTGASLFILEGMGRLDSGLGKALGVTQIGVEAMLGAIVLYWMGRTLRRVELNLGNIIGTLLDSVMQVSDWNPLTGEWSVGSTKWGERLRSLDWGAAMRPSMVLPLLVFSLASAAATESWTVLLLVLPTVVLMREILFELEQNNTTWASGIWLLFFVGFPWSVRIHEQLFESSGTEVFATQIVFDVLMLAGPLLGQFMLTKQGVVKEEGKAADWLLIGVGAVALLDVSGGILLIGMMSLMFIRSIQHRRAHPINTLPIFWGFGAYLLGLLPVAIVDGAPRVESLLVVRESLFIGFTYPAWVGIGWLLLGAVPLILYARDQRLAKSDQSGERSKLVEYPVLMPALSLVAGLHLLVAEPYILMLVVVTIAGIAAWASGKLTAFWVWPLAFAISLNAAAKDAGWFGNNSYPESMSISALASLLVAVLFWRGIMQARASEALPGKFVATPGQIIGFDIEAKHEHTRHLLSNMQLVYAVIFGFLGWNAWNGIVFLLVTLLFSWRLWQRRHPKSMFSAIMLEAMAVGNFANHTFESDWSLEAMGAWLVLSGLILTWASWRNWDFEWKEMDDDNVHSIAGIAGIFGAIYVPLGALMLSDDPGLWMFGAVLSVYGGVQMMIGFDRDEAWRRIYTLISIPLGILIVAGDISNGVMQGVMYLLAALTLFGQGFLYMMRAGVVVSGTGAEGARVSEVFTSQFSLTETDGGVVEQSETTEGVAELEAVDDDVELVPERVDEAPAQMVSEVVPAAPAVSRFDSGEGFDVELPPDVLARIRQALAGTSHEGYKPIVKWDAYGQVILDFVPIE